MPFVTKVVRDYANVDNPGVPFDGPGFQNGGSTSVVNQGGDDGLNLDWLAISGVILGVLLLFLVPYLIWRIKNRKKGGAGGSGISHRLKEVVGGGGHGHLDHEMGDMPPSYLHTGPGLPGAARSEGSLPP